MKILVILIIFVFALSLFRMILEWSKNNNKCSHQRYKRSENNGLYRKYISSRYQMQVTRQEVMVLQCMISPALKSNSA